MSNSVVETWNKSYVDGGMNRKNDGDDVKQVLSIDGQFSGSFWRYVC